MMLLPLMLPLRFMPRYLRRCLLMFICHDYCHAVDAMPPLLLRCCHAYAMMPCLPPPVY